MPYGEWKALHQQEATPEQLARMARSIAKNHEDAALDDALADSFPASDPPSQTLPGCGRRRAGALERGAILP
jgi:hypothetical protein